MPKQSVLLALCCLAPLAIHALSVAVGAGASVAVEEDQDLYLFMVAAVDRDCDGDLADEAASDRRFTTQKTLLPAECVVYRTRYRNDGRFGIRHMRVTNIVPNHMVFIPGSAEHVSTPPGLWPEPAVSPSESEDGSLIWRFGGALGPGESGAIQFRVRLEP